VRGAVSFGAGVATQPLTERDQMRSYLVTTGTIVGLFAAGHLFELAAVWRSPASDPWFTLGVGLIIMVSGALCIWAVRLLNVIGSPAG